MLFISIIIGKIILFINRLTGSGGSAMPGLVVGRIYPGFLDRIRQKNFSLGVILITGTNGKTTSSKMIANILDKAKISYLHNKAGSNLSRGIISSIVEKVGLTGKLSASIGLFEVDEATLEEICAKIDPNVIVITNLFRDQLDRYGELDKTVQKFSSVLQNTTAKICLNSDDPLVAGLALSVADKANITFFGVDSWTEEAFGDENIIDANTSPISDSKLVYSRRYYGHLGLYKSENGDFSRPDPQIKVTKIINTTTESSDFEIKVYGENLAIKLPMVGLYNIYNCLSAIAATSQIKSVKYHDISLGLAVISPAFGRMEKIAYHNRDLHLLLIKNPTGFNQVIQTFVISNPKVRILIIINDNYADGRDVSWLWDSAVEKMYNHQAKIVVSGLRAYDMALRLKYAGITDFEIEADIDLALKKVINQSRAKEKIFILPTYTAMLDVRSKIVKKTNHKEFWK